MLRSQCLARIEWLVVVGVILTAGAMAQADDMILLDDTAPPTTPERWIGVVCTPVGEPLRAQLKLAEDQGLLVREVVPDSPAAKAGLNRYDIVLTANDKPLDNLADLVAAVRAAGDDGLELKILRKGAEKTISIQPAKRPDDRSTQGVPTAEEFDIQIWDAIEDGAGMFNRNGRGLQLRRIAPGISMWTAKPLPDDVSITIKKEGNKPAEITVKQGDQKWEVTGDQFNQLPAKVRGYIAGLAHGITGANISVALPEEIERRLYKGLDVVKEGRRRGIEIRNRVRTVPEAVEKRLKKVEEQMNALLESLEGQQDQDIEQEDQ
jgi:membrane-associated protease RseP (regulator of RpoE activity)